MKTIMISVRLWWFYLTYKGIKTAEIRKRFAKDFKGKIYEYISKTNWKQDLMKIPAEEREFFKQFVGKVGLCFECDRVEEIKLNLAARFFTKELNEREILQHSCLSEKELENYLLSKGGCANCLCGYAIHITKLEIFDKPKYISEFWGIGKKCKHDNMTDREWYCEYCKKPDCIKPLTRAPQSWCYVEV